MIEQPTGLPWGPSLFESLLAQHLLEHRGLRIFFDGPLHRVAGSLPHAAEELDADGLELDDRFPGLNRFGRLLEVGAGHLEAARAAYREQGKQAAVQARALAAFAAARPAALLDRPDEEVGAAAAASRAARPAALTEVSEWAVDEVMVAFGLTSRAAGGLLAESITLAERLPATLDALEAGRISWAHARMLAELVGPVREEVRAGVEARLLARAEGKTVAQLRVAARRAVLHADAAAHARRLAAAIRERSVRTYPGHDGMGTLAATMPIPLLEACRSKLRAYAEECATPGDERTLDQRMLDCLADLILRPGETELPPVQAQLTLVAPAATMAGGDEPGEVNGQPVSAIEIRELAYVLGLLSRPQALDTPSPVTPQDAVATGQATSEGACTEETTAEEATTEEAMTEEAATEEAATEEAATEEATTEEAATEEEAPSEETASEEAGTDEAAACDATARGSSAAMGIAAEGLGQLLALRGIAGTALAEPPQIAIVDEISGQLLALTNATAIRHAATCGHRKCRTGERPCAHPPAGPGLAPPPPTGGYRPSDPLARFVRARDRRCRFPGCRAAAIRCDLDHNLPWPHGSTSADNLCCLCRHHHRLSHQAPGWTMTRLPDGGLQWTTPGGHTVTTHPAGYGTDDDLPPLPPPDEPAGAVRKPISILEQLRRWPPPPPDPDEESPPF